jgi:hypothetical protein
MSRVQEYVADHCWDERRSDGPFVVLYESSSPAQDTSTSQKPKTPMARSSIRLSSHWVMPQHDDVSLTLSAASSCG